MKVLVLNGSPHRANGPTGQLTAALVSGMVEAGASVQTVNAYDAKVGGCLGCFACWTSSPGVCAVRDDMDDIISKLKQADRSRLVKWCKFDSA
jgi:multimeric flavodoxin WrbA